MAEKRIPQAGQINADHHPRLVAVGKAGVGPRLYPTRIIAAKLKPEIHAVGQKRHEPLPPAALTDAE